MHTELIGPDWEQLLYSYYKEHGGYLVGNPFNDNRYPECHLILDLDRVPISVSSIISGSSQYGAFIQGIAQMQAVLNAPYRLNIQHMTPIRRGLELVMKEDIEVHDRELDKKYLIRSNHPEFTKLILPGSSLSRHLLNTKLFRIQVCPIGDEPQLHTIQVICNKGLENSLFGKPLDAEDLSLLIQLCRETYETVTRYPMPESAELA